MKGTHTGRVDVRRTGRWLIAALLVIAAFSVAPSFASADSGSGTPTVSTDQLSYSPGGVVNLTGAGFVAGDDVSVTLTDSLSGMTYASGTAPVSSDGSFTGISLSLPSDFMSSLSATATDPATGDSASVPVTEALAPPNLTPTVTTDKQDYAPGSIVTITGSGWPAGDTVSVATDANDRSWSQTDQITADPSGEFTDQVTLPLMFISDYTVTASDGSGLTATTTFTDGNVTSASLDIRKSDCTTTSASFNSGDTVCAHSAATAITGNGVGTYVVQWIDPSNTIVSTITHSNATTSDTFNDSLVVAATGTWTVKACSNSTCTSGTVLQTKTFSVAGNHPPAVAPNNASATTPEGSNATNTGTWSDADAGDTVTLSASVGTVTKSGTNASGTWSWSLATTDGPAGPTSVTITANDGHTTTQTTFTYSVTNVAPTATFNAPTSVNEGSAIDISLTAPSDPSSADTTAGFTYAFDCGSGYGSFSTTTSASCPTTDNGSRTVKGKIQDKDGGVTEYTAGVTIDNVAPTATLANDGPVNEGSAATISFSNQSDPSSADTTAGFHYAYSCTNGDLSSATYAGSSTAASTTCTFDDNGTYTVKARIIDKDGGYTEYTTSVHVSNVDPTVTLTGTDTADEGDTKSYSYSWTDPGSADTFPSHSVDCGIHGTVSNETFDGTAKTGSFDCTWSDDSGSGTADVTASVTDDDGGTGSDTVNVTVANVPPEATLANDGPVDEGSAATISFSSPSDPSSADTTAGFHYAYSCTNGDLSGASYAGSGTAASTTCTFDDNGTYTVKARILDKDGGYTEHTTSVQVDNVAPTADLGNNGPVDEGSPATVTFSNQHDPSSADTGAGFHYEYNCDGSAFGPVDYAGASSSHTHQCTFDDNGTHTVRARIIDKDGGFTSYTTDVIVENVAPGITAPSDQTSDEGDNHSFDLGTFSDPGADSPWQISVDWGDGSPTTDYSISGTGSASDLAIGPKSHAYADGPNDYTVTVTVTDKDNGSDSKTFNVHLDNVAPTATLAASNDKSVDEGSTHTYVYTVSDPGDDTFTVDMTDCGANGVLVGTPTTTAHGGSFDCRFPDGPATSDVKVKVSDSDGASDTNSQDVQVVAIANVAPVVTAPSGQSSDEGDNHSFDLGSFTDPGADNPWTVTVDWGDLSTPDSFTMGTPGTIPAHSHAYDDGPNDYTVTVTVSDKDSGSDSKTFKVHVDNVAPSATFGNDGPVDEGTSFHLSLTSPSDPSGADTATGFTYAFDCGDGSGYSTFSADSTATCPTDDNGVRIVKGEIQDKDGGITGYMDAVTVNNVAPTADLGNDGPVDEGSAATISFSNQHDPSSADTTAGFHYAYSCSNGDLSGATYANTALNGPTTSCPFDDNGSYTVEGRIIDKDGGYTEYTTDVTVNNVAPTADLGNDGPANEGSAATITFSNPHDPSSADTGAGFHYAYSCANGDLSGATYAGSGGSASTTCTFDDNGTYTVKARIIDKDGGYTERTTDVTVRNVAPTATFADDGPVDEGTSFHLSLNNPHDPSGADTAAGFQYAFDCGDGSGYGSYSGSSTATCPTDDNGIRSVAAKIKDKDGGFTEYTGTVTVNNVDPTVTLTGTASADEGDTKSYSYSWTDPGSADTFPSHSVDCGIHGTVSNETFDGTAKTGSFDCTWSDDSGSGTADVTASVTDDDGGTGSDTVNVTVANVAPTVTVSGPSPVDEGSQHTYDYTVSDPGTDDTYTVDAGYPKCGIGGQYVASSIVVNAHGGHFDCFFPDGPASTNVSLKVTDDDGGTDAGSEGVQIVSVANVPPAVTAPSNQSSNEGENHSFDLGSFTDPGADNPWTVTVDWGDLSTPDSFTMATPGTIPAHSHTYADGPNDYTVTVTVTDKDNGSDRKTFTAHVANVAPSVTLTGATSTNEGTAVSYSYTFTDPGSLDTWTHATGCGAHGARSDDSFDQATKSGSFKCTWPDNYTGEQVFATVTDNNSGADTATKSVDIANVAPSVTLTGPTSANEGDTKHYSYSWTDPGTADTFPNHSVTCGVHGTASNQAFDGATKTGSFDCTWSDDSGAGTSDVTASVSDDDTGTGTDTKHVAVANVAPTVTLTGVTAANEGDTKHYSYSWTDPGTADTFPNHSVACGVHGTASNQAFDGATKTGSFDCAWSDDSGAGTSDVTASVSDDDTGTGTDTRHVTVANVAPAIAPLTATSQAVPVGGTSTVTATFTDPGTADTHRTPPGGSCVFNWDGAAGSAPVVNEANGSGSCSSAGTFTSAGVYSVTVTITDDDGGSTISTTSVMIAVYDPNAGFVTGGGWINSPAGAYRADITLAGRANFGFTAKYQKGQSIPTGETEFDFQVGNLNFHSESYDWLVVSGNATKAQYKGRGTINGQTGYGFLLTAYDGSPDKFRIKIWNIATSATVYDNNYAAPDDIDTAAPTAIAGGSIVIHK